VASLVTSVFTTFYPFDLRRHLKVVSVGYFFLGYMKNTNPTLQNLVLQEDPTMLNEDTIPNSNLVF
jgi:hypothetical protein